MAGLRDFHCFKMGKHADVKDELGKWQYGEEEIFHSIRMWKQQGKEHT